MFVEKAMNTANNNQITDSSKSVQFVTETGVNVTILCLPALDLYVVSDVNNFGSHWFRVVFRNNSYSVETLLGANDDVYSPIARFLAQSIMEQEKLGGNADEQQIFKEKTVVMNISIRHTDIKNVREIASRLKNFA